MERLKRFSSNDYFIITTLFTVAFGLQILNQGVFWDGWVIFNTDVESLNTFVLEIGDMWYHYVQNYLIGFSNGILYLRLIIFFSYLFPALFLLDILRQIKEIKPTHALIIVLFFVFFPVNYARITIAVAKYAICYFLFFLSFLSLSKYIVTNKRYFRILAIVGFFLAFDTSSLLFFYCLPFAFIIYQMKNKIKSISSFFRVILNYADFLLIPILYYVIKQLFFKSYGLYENYNTISMHNIVYSPIQALGVFYSSFVVPIYDALKFNLILLPIILVVFLFIRNNKSEKVNYLFPLLLLGAFSFFIAVFPYLIVGRSGISYGLEWNSRDQLLIPLGASLILFYLLSLVLNLFKVKSKISNLVFSLFIGAFILSNISFSLSSQRDWFKQLSIMEAFKASKVMNENTCFIFIDNTKYLNVFNREYRFYEYTGLMKYSFGNSKRFGIEESDFSDTKNMDYYIDFKKYSHYGFSEFEYSQPQYTVNIVKGDFNLTMANTVKLLFFKIFNSNKYSKLIKQIVKLEAVNRLN